MTDIAVRQDQPVTLWTVEEPEAALAQASKVASAAMEMIKQRGLSKRLGGDRDHVMVDGWLCIARLAKASTHVVHEAPLRDDNGNVIRDEHGRPHGWEARIEVRDAQGTVVADAVSQCARDEKTWKNRDDYAVRSMAQTRATGKALRVALGFVATMAGFEATPAEEMPPGDDDGLPFVEGAAFSGPVEARGASPAGPVEADALLDELARLYPGEEDLIRGYVHDNRDSRDDAEYAVWLRTLIDARVAETQAGAAA